MEVEKQVKQDIEAEEQHDQNQNKESGSSDSGMAGAIILTAVASFALGFLMNRKN